ncbi:MAG: aminotransferase class V-fold PLP-dependent enzyme [Gemmatimonadales bacterium]
MNSRSGLAPAAPPPLTSSYDVSALRAAEFPWADETIFLNHAGIGPLPERVRRDLAGHLSRRAAAHRLTDDDLFRILDRSRAIAATLIGADPTEIALATNTSYGINLAALMLPLEAGDIVLASHGEFPANVFPWRQLARRGVELEMVPVTAEGWPDEARLLERLGDPRVKVFALSLVQFHTGYWADMAAFSARCRATNTYFVIDAIQGLGQIPFDVRDTPVDILACGAQKWLLSPWGSGFTYVRRELIGKLEPPLAGWTAFQGADDFSTLVHYRGDWLPDARRYELVTLPFQDLLGMNGAIGLLLELGIDAIAAHLATITRPVAEWAQRRGVRLASPEGPRASGMICVAPEDPGPVFEALTAAGVVASLREGAIRFSPHCYNTSDEMERVATLLDRAL